MATDHLAPLPIARVERWYRRLANRRTGNTTVLAGGLLRAYLDNRDPRTVLRFTAPAHLINSEVVASTLRYHRAVFLSRERFQGRIAGAVPRLRSTAVTPWDVRERLSLTLHSLCDIAPNPIEILRIQQFGTWQEQDILASLRGFQLHSRVLLEGRLLRRGQYELRILSWMAWATDRYDWNYSEHFTVPNPDFESLEPDAVRPRDRELTVYHSNARRLERAGRAAPFDLQTYEWTVTHPSLLAPETVVAE